MKKLLFILLLLGFTFIAEAQQYYVTYPIDFSQVTWTNYGLWYNNNSYVPYYFYDANNSCVGYTYVVSDVDPTWLKHYCDSIVAIKYDFESMRFEPKVDSAHFNEKAEAYNAYEMWLQRKYNMHYDYW